MGLIRTLGLFALVACSEYSTPEAGSVEGGVTLPLVDASADTGLVHEAGGDGPTLDAGKDAMAGPLSVVGNPCGTGGATVTIASSNNVVLFSSMFQGPPCAKGKVTIVVPEGIRLGSTNTTSASLRIDLPEHDVMLRVEGEVVGAGGYGGSGGNGGSGGGTRRCGRDGLPGGTALEIGPNTNTVSVVVGVKGVIGGGGGGGGGASGLNVAGGGGGGAGSIFGMGGAGATSLARADEVAFCGQDNGVRTGTVGQPGTLLLGGTSTMISAMCSTGAGGALGEAGTSSNCAGAAIGGKAGYAVRADGVPQLLIQANPGSIKGPRS